MFRVELRSHRDRDAPRAESGLADAQLVPVAILLGQALLQAYFLY